ncbi:MAG: HD family phosphohydrolase [Deltaproteobacteria bacterium]|nr:MAG: HD family phosphohydrolase [Deltaproteobacteria bacterium]
MNPKTCLTPLIRFLVYSRTLPVFLMLLVTALYTLFIFPNPEMSEFTYQPGDVVQADVKASRDFFIEDREATAENRQQAADSVRTLYDHDRALSDVLVNRVRMAMDIPRSLDTVQTDGLTLEQSERDDDAAFIQAANQVKDRFDTVLGVQLSTEHYAALIRDRFSRETEDQICRILKAIMDNGVVSNKEVLLQRFDTGIVLRDIDTQKERVVYTLRKFYGLDQSKAMVRILGEPVLEGVHYATLEAVVACVQLLIQPNITMNLSLTKERAAQAAEAVKPVLYKIKAGEMLLREGERVTPLHLMKLKALSTEVRSKTVDATFRNIGMAGLVILILTGSCMVLRQTHPHIQIHQNKDILFLVSLLFLCLGAAKITLLITAAPLTGPIGGSPPSLPIPYGLPIAAGAMTVSLFMGFEAAFAFALILGLMAGSLFPFPLEATVFFIITGTMAAYWIQECRERRVFIHTGFKLGVLNICLASLLNLFLGQLSGITLLFSWIAGFVAGIVAGVVTSGIVPLVELLFDYTTDIKLLELGNPDKPLLRRLMIKAPGTYNHSIIVGTLAEAAAAEVGANPLMARVCGYYHDIGKLKKPHYFIENQTDGKNRHDKLAPSMSALILTEHIKNGVETARKYKLGKPVIDTIQQHHGTSVIRFFYEKARKLKGDQAVNEADFRYPGPLPQTREAAIVMIADMVEAASRTLDNPTPARIQGLVQNLVNKVFSDGQLDECDLTLRDLHRIAKSFIQILTGIHHHRIKYAETAQFDGKDKHEHPDKQPAKQPADSGREAQGKNSGHLKRLGMS